MYSPADYADHAERNAAGCIISQTKTGCLRLRLFFVLWFIVLGFVCDYLRDLREILGSRVLSTKEETQETVAARMQQTVTVSHFVASQATTKI